MRVSERVSILVCAVIALSITTSSFAATLTKISDDAFAPLREPGMARKIRLEKLPLYDGKRSVIELEEFSVWAPGAKVIIHGDNGVVLQRLDPPATRFFRGLVNGDRNSFAYFSVDVKTGKVEGLINTSEKQVAIASTRRAAPSRQNRNIVTEGQEQRDYFLAEDDPFALTPETTWQCALDKSKIASHDMAIHATGLNGLPVTSQGITGTQSYSITVDIETDFEMYSTVAGSNSTTLTTYVTNLSGAVSTIYNRDLKTNLVQRNIHVYTTISDPWSAADPNNGLNELGDHYHSCTSCTGAEASIRNTSAVVMLSGKNIGGGIAWEGIICNSDFFQSGHWGGAYAWCGGIGNLGTTGFGTTPAVNTPPYTMPTGTQNFWPLAEYAHELGHNLGGHHTHCVATTDAERIAAGFTDASPATSASDQVDHCYAHESLAIPDATGCFAGTTDYVLGSQTTFKGTIMSYCHNVSAPQATGSRFTFGQPVEGSHNELDNYMLRVGGPLSSAMGGLDGGSTNIVSGVGVFTISSITASATVAASSTGNASSITASPSAGATYDWAITNGTITGGQGTSAITYTAGATGSVVLRATAYNALLCGVTDTKSVTIGAALAPPTNVEAHATSATTALVSWTAAAGAGRYNVYRSANPDYTAFGFVGFTTGATSYTDAVSTGKAYLYVVRSADVGNTTESANSNRDLATIVVYTNTTLTPSVSTIQRVDLIELRQAIDAVRVLNGIGAPAFYSTDGTVTAGVTTVKKANIDEMRVNLNTPMVNMGFGSPTYTNSTLTAGTSIVTALDFNELRNVMR